MPVIKTASAWVVLRVSASVRPTVDETRCEQPVAASTNRLPIQDASVLSNTAMVAKTGAALFDPDQTLRGVTASDRPA